jgi:hypothetical protein
MKFLEFFGRANNFAVGLISWAALAWLVVLAGGALQAVLQMSESTLWVLGALFTIGVPVWALLRRPTTPA